MEQSSDEAKAQPDFVLHDQGDGWWHCASQLLCCIVDGPSPIPEVGGMFWLVRTEPAIEWHGDPIGVIRWGPNHPLAKPYPKTDLAVVMASSRFGPIELSGQGSVPVYPVVGVADTVGEARWIAALAAKVRLAPIG